MAEFPSFFNKKVATIDVIEDSYAKIYGKYWKYYNKRLFDAIMSMIMLIMQFKNVSSFI